MTNIVNTSRPCIHSPGASPKQELEELTEELLRQSAERLAIRQLPPGPWDDEPDRLEWQHAGFTCLLNRAALGNWCGYVAVPPGHPWHGQDYQAIDATAHGGLTYSAACAGEICHVPAPGEPDDVWWLGFDAGHAWDCIPGMPFGAKSGIYRTLEYMRVQCQDLAEQAKAAALP